MELYKSSAISNIKDGRLIKLRSVIQDIPFDPNHLSLKLEFHGNFLKFKGDYLNKYKMNSSFSPVLIARKESVRHKAVEIQQENLNRMRKKLQKRYDEEVVKLDNEVKFMTAKNFVQRIFQFGKPIGRVDIH